MINPNDDHTPSENQKIIALLEKNNEYLEKLLTLNEKEHRQAVRARIISIIITLIPWLATMIIGYFLWQTLTHYLESLNHNIDLLKNNFDTFHEFLRKLIPDFSQIAPKLKDTWENAKFWQ